MDAYTESAESSPSFEARRWIIAPNGKSAVVRLTEAIEDTSVLEHHDVLIDGCLYTCSRIDTAPHSPPFRPGEFVTLLVETPEE